MLNNKMKYTKISYYDKERGINLKLRCFPGEAYSFLNSIFEKRIEAPVYENPKRKFNKNNVKVEKTVEKAYSTQGIHPKVKWSKEQMIKLWQLRNTPVGIASQYSIFKNHSENSVRIMHYRVKKGGEGLGKKKVKLIKELERNS